MPVKTLEEYAQRWTVSDEPEPAFMISVREWDAYRDRVKTLIDPLENPYGWAQVCGGFALAMFYAALTVPNRPHHVLLFGTSLAIAIGFTGITFFCWWLGKRLDKRHRDYGASIVEAMDRHRDAKAPHAKHADEPKGLEK